MTCWSRILPQGIGRANQPGLDFYSRLIDGLLERGITPLVTIVHGEHPQALEDRGGWANRDMIEWYADYASVLFAALGDRVHLWATLNEPNCFLYQGLGTGNIAPGKKDWKLCYQSLHNALVGHGMAVRRFRESGRPGAIGMVMSVDIAHGGSEEVTRFVQHSFLHRRLGEQAGFAVIETYFHAFAPQEVLETPRSRQEHGCEYETSFVLRFRPDLVHLERLEPLPEGEGPHDRKTLQGVWYVIDWIREVPKGYVGKPQLATPEKGARLTEAIADECARLVRQFKEYDPSRDR